MSFQVLYNGNALTATADTRSLLYAVPCTGLLLDIRSDMADNTNTTVYFVGRRALDGTINGMAEPLVQSNESQVWFPNNINKIKQFSFPVGVSRIDFTASSTVGAKLYIAVLDEFG